MYWSEGFSSSGSSSGVGKSTPKPTPAKERSPIVVQPKPEAIVSRELPKALESAKEAASVVIVIGAEVVRQGAVVQIQINENT